MFFYLYVVFNFREKLKVIIENQEQSQLFWFFFLPII